MQDRPHTDATYQIIRTDGSDQTIATSLNGPPGTWYTQIRAIFTAALGEDIEMERVNVFHDGQYTDMFVDETGMLKGLPVNERATRIYRANVLTHDPNPPEPEDMPAIHGDAVLFSRRVWT